MTPNYDSRTGWLVLTGVVLMVLGVWFMLGWAFAPIAQVLGYLARIGWPLLLVGLGILLVMRARGGGFSTAGRRLYRSRTYRWIGGVLGGVATYLNVDVTLLRAIFFVLTLVTGLWLGLALYLVAMLVLPEEPVAGYVAPPAPMAPEPPRNPAPAPPIPAPPSAAPSPPGSATASSGTARQAPAVPSAPAQAPAIPSPPAPPVPAAPEPPTTASSATPDVSPAPQAD